MKTALAVITLSFGLLAGCNNQPLGMAITLHSKQVTQELQEEVVQTGRVDASIPTATSVLIGTTPKLTAFETASQTQSCMSVAACE